MYKDLENFLDCNKDLFNEAFEDLQNTYKNLAEDLREWTALKTRYGLNPYTLAKIELDVITSMQEMLWGIQYISIFANDSYTAYVYSQFAYNCRAYVFNCKMNFSSKNHYTDCICGECKYNA